MEKLTFNDQINKANEFFKDGSILILLSLVFTYFLSKVDVINLEHWGKLGVSTAFILVVFLFFLIMWQMSGKITDYDFDMRDISWANLKNNLRELIM